MREVLPASQWRQRLSVISAESPLGSEDSEHEASASSEVASSDGSFSASQWASSEASRSSERSPVLIFDWDDVLMPTTFFEFVESASSGLGHARRLSAPMLAAARKHVSHVEELLRTSRSLGRVAIVSMATKAWMLRSSARHVPALDLEALTRELDIPVYEALGYTSTLARHEAMPNAAMSCKQAAIAQCLEDFDVSGSGEAPLNVISVGDALVEREALRDFCSELSTSGRILQEPLFKVVKLMGNPSVSQLSSELRQLKRCLAGMVSSAEGFFISAHDPSEFEKISEPFVCAARVDTVSL